MPRTETPTLDPAILDRNLAALRRTDRALAERLAAQAGASNGPTPAVARDGALNFRLTQPDGQAAWFGRTSIPSVRAAALLAAFDAGEANVLLPGIGQGMEAYLLTRQLGPHRAVFVWEQTEEPIRLALRLHDFAQGIADERLVFIVCDLNHLAETLLAWLDRHRGHLCPNRIMMWPWQQPADLVPCRSALETTYGQIEQRRAQALTQAQRNLLALVRPAGDRPGPGPGDAERPSVAILALHARDETWAWAAGMSQAAGELGWHQATAIVRAPGDVHSLARVARLTEQAGPGFDFALLLDVTRNEVKDIWPACAPAICWLSPRTVIDEALARRAGEHDPILVASRRLAERAVIAGIAPRRITVCPLPCLAYLGGDQADSGNHAPRQDDRPFEVVMIGDLGPTDPASYRCRLPTHIQVWNLALDQLKAQIGTFTDDQADGLLASAEAKCGLRIDDAPTRQKITQALATSVANTLQRRHLAQALIKNGVKVSAYGYGWAGTPGVQVSGPLPSVGRRARALRQAKMAVHADTTGAVLPDTLLAAGCGAVLLAHRHPEDEQPGGLATMLAPGEEMVPFRTASELVAEVRRLLADRAAAQRISDRARLRCQNEHQPAARWQVMRAALTSLPGGRAA